MEGQTAIPKLEPHFKTFDRHFHQDRSWKIDRQQRPSNRTMLYERDASPIAPLQTIKPAARQEQNLSPASKTDMKWLDTCETRIDRRRHTTEQHMTKKRKIPRLLNLEYFNSPRSVPVIQLPRGRVERMYVRVVNTE